ncbi:MAG: class I SAM-dependent methyltransferase [Candidatus Moranbacteria bacterium]|nr:class I SAM-dependent methyltransferase [Candidatus Moranbacteria bacterium]
MDDNLVKKILSETEAGYDLMVKKFSETRKYFWRGLEFIGDYAKNGDKILDYGCGNGRLLELFIGKNIEYFGADVSRKLINTAKNKYISNNIKFQKINSGQVILPFPDNYFNTVYSIAVFHHLPSSELRLKIAKELYRTTQPGGHIIITIWNLWQKRYIKNIFKNWANKVLDCVRQRSCHATLYWNDCYITFKNNEGEIFQRYHHAFTKNELKNLFKKAGFRIKSCKKIHNRNIVLIGEK